MDPSNPKMSGSAEPLDQLIARCMASEPFDAAIVAWDLVPAWNPAERPCRWQETVTFYEMLASSEDLPKAWVAYAETRRDELRGRQRPGARAAAPRLTAGACLALCMDPMFEDVLVQNESAVKRALDVTGGLAGWPKWRQSRNPDTDVIAAAVAALPGRAAVRRRVRGDYRTRKDEWGEYLLRQLGKDPTARLLLKEHPLVARLAELMPAAVARR